MATQNPTVNYAWTMPTVGASDGAWGAILNGIIGDDATGIDTLLQDFEDRIAVLEAVTGVTGLNNRSVVYSTAGGFSTYVTLQKTITLAFGTTTLNGSGIISLNMPALNAAAGGELWNVSATPTVRVVGAVIYRTSDSVFMFPSSVSLDVGNNEIDITVRFRDGAIAASASFAGHITLAFSTDIDE